MDLTKSPSNLIHIQSQITITIPQITDGFRSLAVTQQKIRFVGLLQKFNQVGFSFYFGFWFWEWTPTIGRKVGIPRGILPHVQTGLTN